MTSTFDPSSNSVLVLEEKAVWVYFRLPDSRSLKVRLAVEQTVGTLKQEAEKLLGIAVSQQIIYLGGRELKEDRRVTLTEKAILHVKRVSREQQITIFVVRHLPQKHNIFKISYDYQPIQVKTNQSITDFLSLFQPSIDFDLSRTKLIESGRLLKLTRTFQQEKLQTGTHIHIILRNRIVKDEKTDEEEHQNLVRTVLKHSRHNSLLERQSKLSEEEEPAQLFEKMIVEEDRVRESISSNPMDRCVTNPEKSKSRISSHREDPPHYNHYNHTKSSMMWITPKVVKEKLTPLKFSLEIRKKFDGPKSQRDCACKDRKEQLTRTESSKSLPGQSQAPLESLSRIHKLKMRMSLIF